jgi:hypothetical protein
MLGTTDRAISVSRVIPASPKDTLSAIGVVFTGDPYRLRVNDTVNGHPLDGGILRFSSPRLLNMGGVRQTKKLIYRLEQIALFDLNVTLQRAARRNGPRAKWSSPATCARDCARTFARTGIHRGRWHGGRRRRHRPHVGAAGVAGRAIIPARDWPHWRQAARRCGIAGCSGKALRHATEELNDLLAAVERHLTQKQLFSFDAPAVTPSPDARGVTLQVFNRAACVPSWVGDEGASWYTRRDRRVGRIGLDDVERRRAMRAHASRQRIGGTMMKRPVARCTTSTRSSWSCPVQTTYAAAAIASRRPLRPLDPIDSRRPRTTL